MAFLYEKTNTHKIILSIVSVKSNQIYPIQLNNRSHLLNGKTGHNYIIGIQITVQTCGSAQDHKVVRMLSNEAE